MSGPAAPVFIWPAEIATNPQYLAIAELAAGFHRSASAFTLRHILAAARALHGPLLASLPDDEIIGVARGSIYLLRGLPLTYETLLGLDDEELHGGSVQ